MAEDNITPAVNLQDEMPNEMSAAEFQQRLYAWFEDRGLISELRAHLRKQMIGVLKDTPIGRTVSGQHKQISPKLQALNLLIAEFLLQQDYHYSLSVFSTEVPLISVLPEFPGLIINSATNKREDVKKWRFLEKDMWDILETLGVPRDTDEGKNIFNAYYNSTIKEPLLTCIVRMLHAMKSKSYTSLINENKEIIDIAIPSNSEPWLKSVADLLKSNNINGQNLEEIIRILKKIIEAERKRLKDESREEFLKLQMTLQLQEAKKEEEQNLKLEEIQKSVDIEKEKLAADKISRHLKNDAFDIKVQKHQSVLRERYQALRHREHDIHDREQQLRQREQFLDAQHLNLENSFEKLYRENQKVADLQERLQRELREKQKAAKNDAVFLRDLQEECNNMRNHISHTQEAVMTAASKTTMGNEQTIAELDVQDAEGALVKGLVRQLQIENSGLRTLNSEQQFRIDELSQRAAVLMNDLENSQATAPAPTNRPALNIRSGILSAPPLAAADAQIRFVGGSNSGAGEEGFRPTLPTSPVDYNRHYPSMRDSRRRVPPRRLTIHSSSSSDDHSPTNEVLQEARERLKRLEKESEEVDKHYRQFRSRQAHADHSRFYQRNTSHPRPFESFLVNNGENGKTQGMRSGPKTFNPEVMSHLFGSKYPKLFDEPCSSSRSHSSECQREAASPADNEAPCCSKFQTNQKKKLDLAQLVEWHFNQAISCMTNEQSISDISFERDNPREENNMEEPKKEERERKDAEEERQFDNQSVASSGGILGEMLAAGTSGVSLSDIEASDEKTETQPVNQKD